MVLEICHSLSVVICNVMLIIKTLFHIGKAQNQLMLLALSYMLGCQIMVMSNVVENPKEQVCCY